MAHPLFSFLRSFFHRISRMNRRHSCLSDYSRIFADIWPLANGWRPIYAPVIFCHADFADIHRFWTCSVFGKMHADFADDADFFVGDLCFFVPQISQIYTDSGLVRSLEKSTQISQMTQFFCLDIWGIFLSIMARMNLCKSVESVGLLKRLTFSAFFNTLLPALFLPA